MRNKYLTFILFLFSSVALFGQNHSVKGTVTDNTGDALIGVTVAIEGTTVGTITDIDGKYEINASIGQKLTFAYIGFKKETKIVSAPTLNVTLTEDAKALDDVIVVAYGTVSRGGYTGSASTINTKEISKSQVSDVSRLLQGSASGVQSIASSGQPGTGAKVYIRGVGSVNASSSPLYVIDGAPIDADQADSQLSSINPSDIESVSVLKDAASTALYGSRAANGLVMITTKKGKKGGKPMVDAHFTYGFSSRAVKDYKQVSTDNYFELYWEAMRNQQMYINGQSADDAARYASSNIVSNLGINPYGSSRYPQPVGTDGKIVAGAKPLWDNSWSDAYSRTGHRADTKLNISGGGDKMTYYISLGYLDDQGIALASDFKRYTGRLNLNADLSPRVRINTNIALANSTQNAPKSDDSSTANSLFVARLMPNFYPVYERNLETGAYLENDGHKIPDYGSYRPSGAVPNQNVVGSSNYDLNRYKRDVASIRSSIEVDLIEGLMYRGSANIDYTNYNEHIYVNPKYGSGALDARPGSVSKQNRRTTGFTGNNVLSYTHLFQDVHSFKVLAGQEYYEYNNDYIEGSRNGFPLLGFDQPVAASELGSFTGNANSYKLLSFFGNAEYNFNQKYYGSASIRRDGSSKFKKGERWGTFWSLGGLWKLSEEDFLKDISPITRLSLRSSYGTQGNDAIDGYYNYMNLFDFNNNLGNSGVYRDGLGNEKLKWETGKIFNIGVDYGFFDNRLSGSVEFFDRRSKDLLFTQPKAPSTGYSGYIANVGAVKNVGVEFSISGTPIFTKDWKLDLGLNATHFKNTVTELPQSEIIGNYTIMRKGGSVYDFFLVEWAGIDPEDGLPQWYMTNDNNERVKTKNYTEANTTKSKIEAGTSLPDLVGGFNMNLTYRDFEFSTLFAYSLGGKIYNQDKTFLMNYGTTPGRAMLPEMNNRWTPENRNTNVPRMQTSGANSWTNRSTLMLVNADYLRMKNMMLAYNIPKKLLKKIEVQNLRVFAQAENLLTFFGEKGMDPEQAINGISYFRYPAMKTISFGLNVSF